MDKTGVSALITAVLGIGCIYFFMAVVFTGKDKMLEGVGVMGVEMFIMFLTGIILWFNEKTRAIGRGVFLGMAVTLVVGFGICSTV